jgi:hypothetical protein
VDSIWRIRDRDDRHGIDPIIVGANREIGV